MNAILQVKNVTKRYGGLTANSDISFDVSEGEILSVIGPNGAGKSTLFKQIGGFVTPTNGEVLYKGNRISGLPPHKVAQMGIVRTFQETTIFRSMTVRENIIVAHHLRSKASLLGFFLGTGQARQESRLVLGVDADVADSCGRNHPGQAVPLGQGPKVQFPGLLVEAAGHHQLQASRLVVHEPDRKVLEAQRRADMGDDALLQQPQPLHRVEALQGLGFVAEKFAPRPISDLNRLLEPVRSRDIPHQHRHLPRPRVARRGNHGSDLRLVLARAIGAR